MSGVPVGRIFGLEIRLHLSWLPLLGVVMYIVVDRLATTAKDVPMAIHWAVGVAAALVLLLSVLIHELAHALVARRRGLPDRPLVLVFFGGPVADPEGLTARDEALIAAAGPSVSLALGFVAGALGVVAVGLNGPAGLADGLMIVAVLNLLVGFFNLLPAYPLDGGRLFRAFVWAVAKNEHRATRVSALVGRLLGWAFVAVGLTIALTRNSIDGLMLALVGWFLSNASRGIEQRLLVEELLTGVRVADAMERDLPSVIPQLTLDTFADRYLASGEAQALPVVVDRDWLGLIGVSQLRAVARRAWATTRASEIMVSPPILPTLGPDDDLWEGVEDLRRSGQDGLPVVSGADLLGILTRRAAVAAIRDRLNVRGERRS